MKPLVQIALFVSLFFAALFANANPYRWTPGKPPGDIYIRGIHYKDHTANASFFPTQVVGGNWFEITVKSMWFAAGGQYDIRVILQDTAYPPNSSGGVTEYRLVNTVPRGTMLDVQTPNYPILRGRTYHVSVFLIGPAPMHYAYLGVLKLD